MSSHPQTDSALPVADPMVPDEVIESNGDGETDLVQMLENFRRTGKIDFAQLVVSAHQAGVETGIIPPAAPVAATPAPVASTPPVPAATPAPAATQSPLMGFENNTPEQMRTLKAAGLLPPGIYEAYFEMRRAQRAPAAPEAGAAAPPAPAPGAAVGPRTAEERAMQLIQRLNAVGKALAQVALPLLEGDVALGITLAPDGWIVGSAILEDTEVDGDRTRLQHPILGYDNVEFHQLGDVVGRVLRETVHRLEREQSRGR